MLKPQITTRARWNARRRVASTKARVSGAGSGLGSGEEEDEEEEVVRSGIEESGRSDSKEVYSGGGSALDSVDFLITGALVCGICEGLGTLRLDDAEVLVVVLVVPVAELLGDRFLARLLLTSLHCA